MTNEFQHSRLKIKLPCHALFFSCLNNDLAMQVLVWLSSIQLVRSGMALHIWFSDDLTNSGIILKENPFSYILINTASLNVIMRPRRWLEGTWYKGVTT